MSRTFLLQDWTTVRSSLTQPFIQDSDDWLDLDGYSDVTCWVDIGEVTPPPVGAGANCLNLQLQTAPSSDDAYFTQVAPPVKVASTAPFTQPSSIPVIVRSARSAVGSNLMRFLRWTIVPVGSGVWDLTFRIRAVAARSPTFVPTLIPGCVAWYRADYGLTINGASVLAWNDQSGTNDPNKNLSAGVAPTINIADANYLNQPTVTFARASGQYMTSGPWTTPLVQPNTWFIAGHTFSLSTNQVAMESNDIHVSGQTINRNNGNQLQFASPIAINTFPALNWNTASVLMAEFNTGGIALSKLYFNNFDIHQNLLAFNTGPQGQPSITLGSSSPFTGRGNYWDGTLAEVIAYNRILNSQERGQMRAYFRGRYGLPIV
jgi:hypothetical protein